MEKNSGYRTNIIGAGEVGRAVTVEMDTKAIHETNGVLWDTKGNDVIGTTALPKYGAYISEENNRLFGNVSGKKVLEIGCGTGCSLQYLGERGAAELWGIDLAEKQIEKAERHLAEAGFFAKLICSPMEEECGVPANYFDFVYSVYAIGWTTDLEGTFRRIASYLKKDGAFIFSWSHPIHKCVTAENGKYEFNKCYFDESWYSVSFDGCTLTLSDRTLSTYVNALAEAGFVIERMIEQNDDEMMKMRDDGSDFAKKAKMLPVTFVIKARKL
jgi:2-polyprenyl-3-methyl-5-hydroxy-6-metoxy-1,4-benzoquinol methylase